MRLLILTLLTLIVACSYTPKHQIPVHPLFVEAGVKPGDEIEIITTDGERLRFVVIDVSDETLTGKDILIPMEDVESLFIHSWSKPPHPCGAGRPVGCSVPEVVSTIEDGLENRFAASCARHDYCYRHGYATYNLDRETCDERFLEDMNKECGQSGGLLDMLSIEGIKEQTKCRALAKSMHAAVRRYGAPAFLTTTGTECPYDYPASP